MLKRIEAPEQTLSLIRFEGLTKTFSGGVGKQDITAVRDVTLQLTSGKTLGVVGESGSGKSTLARLVTGLVPPSKGKIFLFNEELHSIVERRTRQQRLAIQMVFQDPMSSLNPRHNLYQIISEPLWHYKLVTTKNEARKKVEELFVNVGLSGVRQDTYPHQISGGQRQRVAIARVLAGDPKLIVWDEPTSALDVSVQAQILTLLLKLQKQLNLTYIFISHSLGVVDQVADQVAVMRNGKIIEMGLTADVLRSPEEQYTQELIAAVPSIRIRNLPY